MFARYGHTTEAKQDLVQHTGVPADRVSIHTADVADEASVIAAVQAAAAAHGQINAVITSAGISGPARFEGITAAALQRTLQINVVGTRNVIYAALPWLKQASAARIACVSSAAGLTGVYGFTAYSASKFAVIGFAQSLRQELTPWRIPVTVHCPPDTDTPMLEHENKSKPPLCAKVSESGGLCSAEHVATDIVDGMCAGDFLLSSGFDTTMAAYAAVGMGPSATLAQGLLSVLLAGPLRAVSLAYQAYWSYLIRSDAAQAQIEATQALDVAKAAGQVVLNPSGSPSSDPASAGGPGAAASATPSATDEGMRRRSPGGK